MQIKPNVFTKVLQEHVFVLHQNNINIYDCKDRSNNGLIDLDLEVLLVGTTDPCTPGLIEYDSQNSDKKLQGESHKEALRLLGSNFIAICISNEFAKPLEEIIVNNRIDLKERYNFVLTYLDYAIFCKKNAIVKLLITKGADVNQIAEDRTPILTAICCENKEIVKTLLLAEADIQKANAKNWGKTVNHLKSRPEIQAIVAEVYNAREAEQGVLKQLIKQKIGDGTTFGKEIIEYLLGKDHKVCAIKKQQT